MRLPGETLSQCVKRGMAEEGPLAEEQECAGFNDGNKQHAGAAVTVMLGAGKGAKEAPVTDEGTLMPITHCTDDNQGMAFVIGVGCNLPEWQAQPKRAPSATSSHTPRRGGAKAKKK